MFNIDPVEGWELFRLTATLEDHLRKVEEIIEREVAAIKRKMLYNEARDCLNRAIKKKKEFLRSIWGPFTGLRLE